MKSPAPIYEMKHRLTGAVIIIAMMVILVPLLLQVPTSAPHKDWRNLVTQENNLDSGQINTRQVTALVKPAPQKSEPSSPISGENSDQVANTTSQTQSQISLTPKTKPVQQNSALVSKTQHTNVKMTGWSVRAGTYTKAENVENVSKVLTDSGFNVNHTKVDTDSGQAVRVWIGPYANKKAAEEVREHLKTLVGEKGYISKLPS